MTAKHVIPVDSQGFKNEFVLVETIVEEGKTKVHPISYHLKEGQSLIFDDVEIALSMLMVMSGRRRLQQKKLNPGNL